jgi:ribosomal protein S3AE
MGGKKLTRQELRPVAELAKEVCCPDRCVRIALTQYKLVESWRKVSQTNQQGVRKVVQEMLADNGEQTNCHKFITMVTGVCS